MNTMTIDDVVREAKSRSAAIEVLQSEFKDENQIVVLRQWDVPHGVRERGILYFVSDDGPRVFSIKYIQYKKLIDVGDWVIKTGPYRDWSDFFMCADEKYIGLRDDEIVALVHIDREILL